MLGSTLAVPFRILQMRRVVEQQCQICSRIIILAAQWKVDCGAMEERPDETVVTVSVCAGFRGAFPEREGVWGSLNLVEL